MIDEQYQKCLTCLYRKKHVFDKHKICNLRGKDLNFSGECQDYVHDPKAYVPEHPERFELYRLKRKPFIRKDCIFLTRSIIGAYYVILVIDIFIIKSRFTVELLRGFVTLFIIFWLLCFFKNRNKIAPLNADYVGDLILGEDKITVIDREFPLDWIEKIRFYEVNYEGEPPDSQMTIFFEPDSNGIGNSVQIDLKNGKQFKFNYYKKSTDKLLYNKHILSYYYKRGKITRYDMIKIFGNKYVKLLDKIDLV